MPAEQRETKQVLTAKALVQFLYRLKGGQLIEGSDIEIDDLLEEHEFSTGPEGKNEKLAFAQEGNVLVAKSIVTVADDAAGGLRLLLWKRNEPHVVTVGGSILTSGSDMRAAPAEVLAKKANIAPMPTEFVPLGIGFSDPKQTKGINYLFQIYRARLSPAAEISSKTSDALEWASPEDAAAAIAGKALEQSILRKVRANS